MRSTPVMASLLVLSILAGLASADEPIEYTLAAIDAGWRLPEDDISVARFRSLLQQLSEKFVESRQQIGHTTIEGQRILREKGIKEKMLNVMESINRIFSAPMENQRYSEYIGVYILLRDQGQSHRTAIAGIRSFLVAHPP